MKREDAGDKRDIKISIDKKNVSQVCFFRRFQTIDQISLKKEARKEE